MSVVTSITASADSRMNSRAPTTNYGSDLTWKVGFNAAGAEIDRGILKFPVVTPVVPVGKLKSVNLFFRQTGAAQSGELCRVHNVVGGGRNFVEGEITWNVWALGQSWVAGGGDFDAVVPIDFTLSPIGPQSFNLDALAMWNEQIVTRGQTVFVVILKRVSEAITTGQANFDSREAASNKPTLTLTHEVRDPFRFRGRPPLKRTPIGIGVGF